MAERKNGTVESKCRNSQLPRRVTTGSQSVNIKCKSRIRAWAKIRDLHLPVVPAEQRHSNL